MTDQAQLIREMVGGYSFLATWLAREETAYLETAGPDATLAGFREHVRRAGDKVDSAVAALRLGPFLAAFLTIEPTGRAEKSDERSRRGVA